MIELDNNATTRPTPGVVEAVTEALVSAWHNPSSVHRGGQEARARLEKARASLAALIGARARELILTGSGTESIDLALRGALAARAGEGRTALVTDRAEHNAVRDLAEHLGKQGVDIRWAPIDSDGRVDPARLAEALDERVAVVSVQWANNETGLIQPIDAIAGACRARGAWFHCDGTQWVGKMPTDMGTSTPAPGEAADARTPAAFDLLSFSPHKFHGPKGVGVLWRRRGVRLAPTIHGTQELGMRGGTENTPGILGAGRAAEEARAWLTEEPESRARLAALRERFEARVREACAAAGVETRVLGAGTGAEGRLWNTTNIAFRRLEAEAMLLILSELGVSASAGAACSSGSLDPSPVLLAMGVAPEWAHGAVRFSLSRETTEAELDEAARLVPEAARRLAGSMARLS